MKSARIALLVEDNRFLDFLEPAIETIARNEKVKVAFTREKTRGCRAWELLSLLGEVVRHDAVPRHDFIVVGADAKHREGPVTWRQKAKGLAICSRITWIWKRPWELLSVAPSDGRYLEANPKPNSPWAD